MAGRRGILSSLQEEYYRWVAENPEHIKLILDMSYKFQVPPEVMWKRLLEEKLIERKEGK